MSNNREDFYVRKNLFEWLMQRGWHKRHGIMKVGRVTLEKEEAAKKERYPQVVSVEKLRFAGPQAGTRCEERREEGMLRVKEAGDRFYRLDIMFTTRNAHATPCRQTGPDVSCWELVGFTSGDKNRPGPALPSLLTEAWKSPLDRDLVIGTFRHRLRVGSLRAEIHRTMWVVTLVCHLVNLFSAACSPQLGCRSPFTVCKDGRLRIRGKKNFFWLFLPFFVTLTRQLGSFRSNQSAQ